MILRSVPSLRHNMRRSSSQKGFTVIELLIVIAIIGILASIILISVNKARKNASDTVVISQLAEARTTAQFYYENNNRSFAGMCSITSSDPSNLYRYLQGSSYPSGTVVVCNDAAAAYAIQANLVTAGFWCIDSSGVSKSKSVALGSATSC